MAASLLGKRRRESESEGCVQTRSKRQAQAVIIHTDENEEPAAEGDELVLLSPDVKKLAIIKSTPKKKVGRPAKHGAQNARVAPSPTTINTHFSVSKSSISREKDTKTCTTTPQTVRFRDALSKQAQTTPRHRVQISGTPKTPRTPTTPSQTTTNVYNQARQIFSRCSNPGSLVGRDEERQELARFISSRLESSEGGCLYVSGPPGTGKSALVAEILEQTKQDGSVCSVVNCMSVKNAADLANKLTEDFSLGAVKGRGGNFDSLRKCFFDTQSDSCKYIAILDEVDQLVDLDLNLLYNLFEWSMQPSSNLILIGIANALDLTDRLLPRLKSRNLKPDLLPFMPYNAQQIAQIITTKLKALNTSTPEDEHVPFLHPAAIQFCSKKVAAQTGDLRKAFDICARAIDLIEQETKAAQATPAKLALEDSPSKTPLTENINLSSPPIQRSPSKTPRQLKFRLTSDLSHYTTQTAPRATIAHIAKVTSAVFSNGTTQRLQSLNIQQKAVLCALAAAEKKRRESASNSIFATPSKTSNGSPTIKQLFETYSTLCKRENLLHPLTSVEFRDVVGGLETLSLVSAVEGKNGSFANPLTPSRTPSRKGKSGFGSSAAGSDEARRMATCVGHQELLSSLQGPGSEILRDILDGVGL